MPDKQFFALVRVTLRMRSDNCDLIAAEHFLRETIEEGFRKQGDDDKLDDITVYASESEMEKALHTIDKGEGEKQ